MDTVNEDMKDCTQMCWECRATCQETLFNHCLEEGGRHVAPDHVRVIMDCIEICQTAADFMTRNSPLYLATCAACADICEACARSCEKIGGDHMNRCAEHCRRCAESCRAMGKIRKAA